MKLLEHKSLSEKNKFFQHNDSYFINIDTKSAFDKFYSSIIQKEEKGRTLYRGVSEAKYFTYTSAQRYYLTHEIYKIQPMFRMFVRGLIENLKKCNNELLTKYFDSVNVEIDDYLLLSYLQHYGAPSTFLDVSYNINKSLYFAFDKMKWDASNDDIDNYVSLYILNSRRWIPIWEWAESTAQAFKNSLAYNENQNINKKDTELLIDSTHTKDFEALGQMICLYVSGDLKGGTLYKCISNLNLTAQDGAFLFYYNIETPFEYYMINDDIPWGCCNIHKSLKDYIIKKYLDGITEKTIYPKGEDLVQDALKMFLKQ